MEPITSLEPTLASSIQPLVNSLRRLCKHANLKQSRYPFLPLTYSLWRKDKYQQLLAQLPEIQRFHATALFHQSIDYTLFDEYCTKVESAIFECLFELKTPESLKLKQVIDSGGEDQLIEEYCRAAARQLTAVQRLTDLIGLPYAIPVRENLQLREEFATGAEKEKGVIGSIVEKHGQAVAFKGLGKLSTSIFGKFAIGLSSMIGGVNVVGLAGGYAIGKIFDIANDKLQLKRFIDKLKQQMELFEKNTAFLNERYERCRKHLSEYLKIEIAADRKVIKDAYVKCIKQVFQHGGSQAVIVTEVENDWKVVQIDDTEDDFEELKSP